MTKKKGCCKYPNTYRDGKRIPLSRNNYMDAHPEYVYKKGDLFLHLDGNSENNDPSNLFLCTRGEMLVFNSRGGIVKGSPEATYLRIMCCRLKIAEMDLLDKKGLLYTYKNHRYKTKEFKEKQSLYHAKNKEHIRQLKKDWVNRNREKVRECNRKWREANPDKVLEYRQRYRQKRKNARLSGPPTSGSGDKTPQ